jgi:hypothetical protein
VFPRMRKSRTAGLPEFWLTPTGSRTEIEGLVRPCADAACAESEDGPGWSRAFSESGGADARGLSRRPPVSSSGPFRDTVREPSRTPAPARRAAFLLHWSVGHPVHPVVHAGSRKQPALPEKHRVVDPGVALVTGLETEAGEEVLIPEVR